MVTAGRANTDTGLHDERRGAGVSCLMQKNVLQGCTAFKNLQFYYRASPSRVQSLRSQFIGIRGRAEHAARSLSSFCQVI